MMYRAILAAIVIAILAFFLAENSNAQEKECKIPQVVVSELEADSKKQGYTYDLTDYQSLQVQAAREYILSKVPDPQNVFEFDRMFLVTSPENPEHGYVALFNEGCMIAQFADTVANIEAIINYVERGGA